MPDEEKKDESAAHRNPIQFRAASFAEHHRLPDFGGDVCIVTGGSTGAFVRDVNQSLAMFRKR